MFRHVNIIGWHFNQQPNLNCLAFRANINIFWELDAFYKMILNMKIILTSKILIPSFILISIVMAHLHRVPSSGTNLLLEWEIEFHPSSQILTSNVTVPISPTPGTGGKIHTEMRKLILNVKVVTMELLKVEYSLYFHLLSSSPAATLGSLCRWHPTDIAPSSPLGDIAQWSGCGCGPLQDTANCHSKRICLFTSNLSRLQQSDLHQPTNDQRTKLCSGFQYVFPSYLPTPTQLYLYFDI